MPLDNLLQPIDQRPRWVHLVEIHDEWDVTDRRYLSEGSMKTITTVTKE